MPPKRACDTCIARKIKCSGSWPCGSCCDSIKKVECTYLKPPRRRGPKVRRRAARRDQDLSHDRPENNQTYSVDDTSQVISAGVALPFRISKDIIAPIVRLYREHSYSVWPVINADALLEQLEDIELENTESVSANIACLVTALCAATMAQLQLDPVMGTVDSTVMAKTCVRIRSQCSENEEHFHFTNALVSFFLHVYHAKVNQCNTAWSYIQEAISRILQLDVTSVQSEGLPTFQENDIIYNRELIFPLLWVSERGYAMHLGLSPSCIDPPPLTGLGESSEDIHAQGLLDLVRLFIAFDQISLRHKSGNELTSATHLTETENRLSSLYLNLADQISTRTADCHITREWMRTILWQRALSMGLLSSSTSRDVMTFSFPAKVSRDLLHSLRFFSETDLLPLGRDQLLKCFEVANSLADTALLNFTGPQPTFQLSPKDFLHALYQKLSPFLEKDPVLNSILRAKTAEVLVMAPARLLTMELGNIDCEPGLEMNMGGNKESWNSEAEDCYYEVIDRHWAI